MDSFARIPNEILHGIFEIVQSHHNMCDSRGRLCPTGMLCGRFCFSGPFLVTRNSAVSSNTYLFLYDMWKEQEIVNGYIRVVE